MKESSMRKWLIGIVCFFLMGCRDYPKDPQHTLEDIKQNGFLEVGLVHNPPWVDITTDVPTGVEIELIKTFSQHLGAKPKWHIVSLDKGVTQLKNGELHIMIGGLLQSTPYKKVGYTRPYPPLKTDDQNEAHVMAVRLGENQFITTLEKHLKLGLKSHENHR